VTHSRQIKRDPFFKEQIPWLKVWIAGSQARKNRLKPKKKKKPPKEKKKKPGRTNSTALFKLPEYPDGLHPSAKEEHPTDRP